MLSSAARWCALLGWCSHVVAPMDNIDSHAVGLARRLLLRGQQLLVLAGQPRIRDQTEQPEVEGLSGVACNHTNPLCQQPGDHDFS